MRMSFDEYLNGVIKFTSNIKEKYNRKYRMKFFSFSRYELEDIKEKANFITKLENFLIDNLFKGKYINYDLSMFLKIVYYVLDEVHKLSFTESWYNDVLEGYLLTDEFIRKLTIFFEKNGDISIRDYINQYGKIRSAFIMNKDKLIDEFEDAFNEILEEQVSNLLEKYPSLKLQEYELREKMKEELKRQFLLMKENSNFDNLEPDEKILNEVISKIPLIYNETVLMYKFIYDYIEDKNIKYNYYQELKDFYKTINDMKYNKELTLINLFEGSNKINEVMLKATNSKEETDTFQNLIMSLDEYTKDN